MIKEWMYVLPFNSARREERVWLLQKGLLLVQGKSWGQMPRVTLNQGGTSRLAWRPRRHRNSGADLIFRMISMHVNQDLEKCIDTYILRTKIENALETSFPSIRHLSEMNMTSINATMWHMEFFQARRFCISLLISSL